MFGNLANLAFALLTATMPPLALVPPALEAARGPAAALPQAFAGQSLVQPRTATYDTAERAVSNWRTEAAVHLDLDPSIAKAFSEGGDPRSVPRCVKLNNYWCIKGTGWNGMLAADPEGHAAFASAADGAAVAALLLRRYYLDFSRRSAQDIVSRWAPPQCGLGAPAPPSPVQTTQFGSGYRIAQLRRPLGPAPLAMRGLGNTLRGRYLAARRHGAKAGLRRSVIASRALPAIRAQRVSTGFSSIEIALAPPRAASLLLWAAKTAPANFAPLPSCADDGARLRGYALKIIDGAAPGPGDDLKLFDAQGGPAPAFARVLANMAGVEIGPLKANDTLVETGIGTAMAAVALAAQAAAVRALDAEKPTIR